MNFKNFQDDYDRYINILDNYKATSRKTRDLIEEDKLVSRNMLKELKNRLEELFLVREKIQEYFDLLPKDTKIEELSNDQFYKIITQLHNETSEKQTLAFNYLSQFLSIRSKSPKFDDALNSSREEAKAILLRLDENLNINELKLVLDESTKYQKFIEALRFVETNPSEPSYLVDEVIPNLFSSYIYRGLITNQYELYDDYDLSNTNEIDSLEDDSVKSTNGDEIFNESERFEQKENKEVNPPIIVETYEKPLGVSKLKSDFKENKLFYWIFVNLANIKFLTLNNLYRFCKNRFYSSITIDKMKSSLSKLVRKGYITVCKIIDLEEEIYIISGGARSLLYKEKLKSLFKEFLTFFDTELNNLPLINEIDSKEVLERLALSNAFFDFDEWLHEKKTEKEIIEISKRISFQEGFFFLQEEKTESDRYAIVPASLIFDEYFELNEEKGEVYSSFLFVLQDADDSDMIKKKIETKTNKYNFNVLLNDKNSVDLIKWSNNKWQIITNKIPEEVDQGNKDFDKGTKIEIEDALIDLETEKEDKEEKTNNDNQENLVFNKIISLPTNIIEFDQYFQGLDYLFSENEILDALVFSKAVSLTENQNQNSNELIYNWIKHSLSITLDDLNYSGNYLNNLETKTLESNLKIEKYFKAFKYSSYLWALITPKNKFDYGLTAIISQFFETEDEKNLKQAIHDLFKVHEMINQGLNKSVLNLIESNNNQLSIQERISKTVDEFNDNNSVNISFPENKKFISDCFGKGSDIYNLLEIVKNDDHEKMSFLLNVFEEKFGYVTDSNNQKTLEINEDKINDFIDTIRSNSSNKLGPKEIKIMYTAREKIINNILKRLNLIIEWHDSHVAKQVYKKQDILNIELLRKSIISKLKQYLQDIKKNKTSLDNLGSKNIVTFSVLRVIEFLEKFGVSENQFDFVDYLKSPFIILKNNRPVLYKEFQAVEGYEPWRQVARHIVFPKLDLEEALEKIGNNEDLWINNLNQLELIWNIINPNKNIPNFEQMKSNAQIRTQQELTNFVSELEIDYAYYRLDENTVETIIDLIESHKKLFYQDFEFGKFLHYLSIVKTMTRKERESRRTDFLTRLEAIEINLSENEDNKKKIELTRQYINKENYTVAEEYINYLSSEDHDLLIDDAITDIEENNFLDFINVFNTYYTECNKNKSRSKSIKTWGYDYIKRKMDGGLSSRHFKSTEALLSSWPAGKLTMPNSSSAAEKQINNLFDKLGFNVKKVTYKENISRKNDIYEVEIKPLRKNLFNYNHPIAIYGTGMNSTMTVINIFGNHSANELISDLSEVKLSKNTIVILDSPFPMNSRRELAENIKKNQVLAANTFLLIDQVLILYLAKLEETERLTALLKCTLPFTYFQPFVDGAGLIPDDMFIGRRTELTQILDDNGPVFLYGGRQLGKSALLHRAKSIKDNPEENIHAIYIDANKSRNRKLIKKIIVELVERRMISRAYLSKTDLLWDDLFDQMSNALEKNTKELILYIDEADSFLEEIEKNNYVLLSKFLELRRKSNNRFRFVFAGLHNVLRFNKGITDNSFLPQLGSPLCIKPLSASDSFKLIEKPLTYLGFHLEQDQMALILANSIYFPGIIHSIGYAIVNSVRQQYIKGDYSFKDNPPYPVKEKNLRTIFNQEKIISSIKEKINITLELDKRYLKIAQIFAYLYYTEKSKMSKFDGFSASKILDFGIDMGIEAIKDIPLSDISGLMVEMCDMGILSRTTTKEMFRLRKNSFRDIIASSEEVALELLAEDEKQ